MILRIPTLPLRHWAPHCRALHTSRIVLSEVLRDESIRARYVRVVDNETGTISSDAKKVQRLLRELDRTKYWLVQVKGGKLDAIEKADKADSSSSKSKSALSQTRPGQRREEARQREEMEAVMPLEDLAIVKLIDKKQAYNRERDRKLEKKEGKKVSVGGSASAHKEADISWSSTPHDIDHKLKQLRTHLKKKGPGARCTIDIKAKAQKGRDGGLSDAEKKEMIERMVQSICEWKVETQDDGDETATEIPAFHARQAGQTQWRDKNKRAIVSFEVVKGARSSA